MNTTRRRDAARSRQALLAAAADLFAERGYAGTAIRSVGDRAGVDPALIARYFGGKEGLYQAVLAADPLLGQSSGDHPGPPAPPSPAQSGNGTSESAAGSVAQAGDTATSTTGTVGTVGTAGTTRTTSAVGMAGAAGSARPNDGEPVEPLAAVSALVDRAITRWTSTGVSAAAQNVFRREVDAAAREATRERLDTVLLPLRDTITGPDPELAAELAVALLFGVGVARDAGTLPRLSTASADELREPLIAVLATALGLTDAPQA
ncbi:TetR family transcriptional regulator [Frankia sp. CcI49]|uniref:helix-turn-helix domain-containing protein n=1 Tax=unclassified Frankia TaxID=2632575 RepID=UPI0006C9EE46|nr:MULTISPECIES: helix-turn-helix domain-containing protein [unclassified Frankia]KPM54120.1 TetR family transcriptional regulator [Frankia sp. R43]ONH61549.1 TetR family transcriptional regulator [Frankia sp. CcI49]